mmetsp:Transcript_45852/g.99882  ORF Transcript_45852/g.99882 Transcript_45852/m.99882 type:complete len:149 (-) Transcript_45852:83-529(-)
MSQVLAHSRDLPGTFKDLSRYELVVHFDPASLRNRALHRKAVQSSARSLSHLFGFNLHKAVYCTLGDTAEVRPLNFDLQLVHNLLGLLFFDIQLLQETPDALPHCITFVLARPGWSCLRCHKVMAEGAGVTPLAARGREKQTLIARQS